MRISIRISLKQSVLFGIVSLSAFLAGVPSSLAAEWSSPLVGGGGGDRAYNLDCGAGAVLTGVNYKSGMFVDRLSAVCRKINSNGSLGETFTRGTTGGTGGFAAANHCKAGHVAGSLTVWAGGIVNGLWLQCYEWNPFERKLTTKTEGGIVVGGIGGPKQGPFMCPDGKPGKALRGKSGIYVDSVRLVCDDWNR